jgi:hypothetical protein
MIKKPIIKRMSTKFNIKTKKKSNVNGWIGKKINLKRNPKLRKINKKKS